MNSGSNRECGTHQIECVGQLEHLVVGDLVEKRHRPEELDAVLEFLQPARHHDVLEDAALQHPHLAGRVC